MNTIVLIGAGQLGSRHLQALANLNIPVEIEVVDPSAEALNVAKQRFEEVEGTGNVKSIEYVSVVPENDKEIDVCIIATTSKYRADAVKDLLNKRKVKNIIFEKVLFQTVEDYESIKKLLKDKSVKAWVNCPRRMYPGYNEIKKELSTEAPLFVTVQGGDWGLIDCNAVHFIDLLAFLSGTVEYEYDVSGIDKNISESKRTGYISLSGTLSAGNKETGDQLVIHNTAGTDAPFFITITGKTMTAQVDEIAGKAMISKKKNKWEREHVDFAVPYQSQLTDKAVYEIIAQGKCPLASFEESSRLHLPFIKALLAHISTVKGKEETVCPIT